MAALLRFARVVPAWAWVLLAVLAWGGWNQFKADRATAKVQRAQLDRVNDLVRTQALREQAMHGALLETTRRLTAQQEAARNAERRRLQAAAAAASAADALRMLEHDAAAAAARACPGDPAAAAVGPAGQLADALGDSAARYLAVARVADDAIIRGLECEQRYDALTQRQAAGARAGPR